MDPHQWLDDFRSRITEMQRRSDTLAEDLAAVSATVSSQDGSVTVTIGPNGGLRDLRLGHRAARHGPARLSALIMDTVREGQRQAARQVREAFAPLGAGSEAMRRISGLAPAGGGQPCDQDPAAEGREPEGNREDDDDQPW